MHRWSSWGCGWWAPWWGCRVLVLVHQRCCRHRCRTASVLLVHVLVPHLLYLLQGPAAIHDAVQDVPVVQVMLSRGDKKAEFWVLGLFLTRDLFELEPIACDVLGEPLYHVRGFWVEWRGWGLLRSCGWGAGRHDLSCAHTHTHNTRQ